jgi:LEA14-like dessication related protein
MGKAKRNFAYLSLLVSAAFLVAVGCASLIESVVSQPKVSFGSVTLRDAQQEGATAVISLNVENPNGVSLTVDKLRYAFELGGRQVAAAEIEKVATIAARTTSKVEIPVPFRYDQVFMSVLDLIARGTAGYKVTGAARIGIFNLPFDHTGELKIRE